MTKHAVQVRDVKKRFSYSRHNNKSIKSAITQAFKPKDKTKDTFYALNGISFNVEKGDFFGILGRNGSGKSTLLKIISEIYQPTSGSVKHDGNLVSFIELGVGFKPELTGRQNVFLNGALLGFSKSEIEEMYDEIVSFAELEKFMDQKLKNYSSGMKVRLAFSVAIRSKSDILILDEVLAVGDAAFKRKSNEYFMSLKDTDQTIILVTHSMANVKKFCNKAIVIDEGKIIFEGEADEAAAKYLSLFEKPDLDHDTHQNSDSKDVYVKGTSIHQTDDEIRLDVTVAANSKVDDLKLVVKVNNAKDKTIAGFNTLQNDPNSFISLKQGEENRIRFKFGNIFKEANYLLRIELKSTNDTHTYDSVVHKELLNGPKNVPPYGVTVPVSVEHNIGNYKQ